MLFCCLWIGQTVYFSLYAQESAIYCIQLGVLKNIATINAMSLKSIGAVHTEDAGEGRTRVLLGKFKTRPDADHALIQAIQNGYTEAFIVARTTETTAPKPTTTVPPTATLPEKIFLIQIGAYSQAIPPADLDNAVKFGRVYSEKVGALTKVYIGTFNTAELATQTVAAMRSAGLIQSFKREVPSASLSQLIVVRESRLSNQPPKASALPGAPVLFSDKAAFIEDMAMFDNGSDNDTLAIGGNILPISAKECLFIGTLDPYNSDAYQPLVLRTEDGGKSWNEVMASEYGNSINSLQFVGKKTIFLTTMWVIEGPGEVNLFRSDDAGKTWRKVSKIPRNDFLCVSSYLNFSDANKGKIIYTCSDEGYWVWETTDGGVKWKSKGKMANKDFKKLKNSSLLDYTPKPTYTAVNDASVYKQISTPDVHIIQLRNAKTKKFAEISRLVKWYKMNKDKQIVPR